MTCKQCEILKTIVKKLQMQKAELSIRLKGAIKAIERHKKIRSEKNENDRNTCIHV